MRMGQGQARSGLQRADRGGCRTCADRGAAGDDWRPPTTAACCPWPRRPRRRWAHPASLNVVADAGYSNGEQARPARRRHRAACACQPRQSTIRAMERCSTAAGSTTTRPATPSAVQSARRWSASSCKKERQRATVQGAGSRLRRCALKSRCTAAPQRYAIRHLHEERWNGRASAPRRG